MWGHVYGIRDRWFSKPEAHILITRKFRQRLSDISAEDVQKEEYRNIWEFAKAWEEVHGPDSWDTDLIVAVYEFKLVKRHG